MTEAVIVSTARTPIGKAFRGAFNMTHGATLGGHVVKHAVERAGIDPAEVEDVVLGCATPEKATGSNIARLSAIRAGLPVTVSGVTVNRFCSSGLQTIAMAAQRIIAGEADCIVAGGLESISLTQEGGRVGPVTEDWLLAHKPEVWMPMIETADIVAARYNVSARGAGRVLAGKPAPHRGGPAGRALQRTRSCRCRRRKKVVDKNTKAESIEDGHAEERRGQPPRHQPRRPRGAQAGARGRLHHGRQCEPALRRRVAPAW